ncbi:Class II Aldolase and Adducin N-terminal domain protein [Acididesulfobacillus acetoxydans]|uniref:Class II Aldolase and Adducin N-terminal domain protein n=1 Tax=Acididesulfobacillus acetoxydans TaxID=1561005 RepID=A0A8S0XB82_9FIRM|nr:class II aldolase/adducin family protein [Acididesulfobacillus acetoxydans]CAA7600896.1 Class II Aldolase and Adducin N-terminal domain protein [Acididesulfobacillus acetoxydans]CEJ08302.1 Ribulose-5-phosphate 4-epimerase-like epimerase or aldolase [Acididesulfobacillus acetoxydans]
MLLENLRYDVIKCAVKMATLNLVVGTFGNVSARDPETNYVALTPSGMDYNTLQPEDIVILDLSGHVVDGHRKPTTETPMHMVAYQRRSDVNVVVHTHSVYATALSVADEKLPIVVTEMANVVGGEVLVAPYTTPGTVELGNTALNVMNDHMAVLLKNHGVLAVGDTMNTALNVALIVEETAKIFCISKSLGRCDLVPEAAISGLREAFLKYYGSSST